MASWRHHYIPQFYIRKFADESGMLFVYDKQSGSLNQRPSKSVFFEPDRNTIDGHDNLEKLYAEMDSKLSKSITRLNQGQEITDEDFYDLLFFVQVLKWRIPANDEHFDKLVKDLSLDDLKVKIRIGSKNVEEPMVRKHLLNSTAFKESKRLMIPFIPYYDPEHILKVMRDVFVNVNPDRSQALSGDNPVLSRLVDIIVLRISFSH
jgi:hypothetical protein